MKKILVILGPTATGKTDLALQLADQFQGELVSCDSRQVYKKLDIGTGKIPNGQWTMDNGQLKKGDGFWRIGAVKVWLYDVVDTKIQYTVADYVKDANKAIDGIVAKGKLPIIVGGTGFYLKALLEGMPNLNTPVDKQLRLNLKKLSLEKLQKELQKISLQKWTTMDYSDQQNPRRLIRAIELAGSKTLSTGKTQSFNALKIGLNAKRDILYKRIDERVIGRINQGMLDETKNLQKNGLTFTRMKQLGLEYGVLADYLEGRIKRQELVKIMQGKIHNYLRRQLTWFKKEKNISWFDIADPRYPKKVEKLIAKWYDSP